MDRDMTGDWHDLIRDIPDFPAGLIRKLGAELVSTAVIQELEFPGGRKFLSEHRIDNVISLATTDG